MVPLRRVRSRRHGSSRAGRPRPGGRLFFCGDKAARAPPNRPMFDLTLDGPVARLRLDRPEARNAIPARDWALLAHRCGEAARVRRAPARPLGHRARPFARGPTSRISRPLPPIPRRDRRFRQVMRTGLDALRDLPIATIAAIEGPCYGAGVALAMACDIRVAGEGALRHHPRQVRHLLSAGGRRPARRPGRAGTGVAAPARRRHASTRRRRRGSGWSSLLAADVGAAVDELAEAILANSGESIAVLKRAIRLAAEGASRDEGQDRSFDALFGSADFRERLAALRPRR